VQDLIRERHNASHAPIELDRRATLHRQADILQHLTGIHLGDEESADAADKLFDDFERKWADGYGPQKSDPDPLLARSPYGR
jgi:hypothetical protein